VSGDEAVEILENRELRGNPNPFNCSIAVMQEEVAIETILAELSRLREAERLTAADLLAIENGSICDVCANNVNGCYYGRIIVDCFVRRGPHRPLPTGPEEGVTHD
jgi:hypothetical protein